MAARDVLKNVNLFVDGRGYAGQVDDLTLPDLSIQTEDYRGGGMDAPIAIDLGMEAFEFSFNMIAYDADVLQQFGLGEGSNTQLTIRGALESYDGTVKPVVINMTGKITKVSRGTWTPGQKPQLAITARPDYYKETHDGNALYEIDIINMKRIINGEDVLAEHRTALGI